MLIYLAVNADYVTESFLRCWAIESLNRDIIWAAGRTLNEPIVAFDGAKPLPRP